VNFNVNFNVLLSKYKVHPLVKIKTLIRFPSVDCVKCGGVL